MVFAQFSGTNMAGQFVRVSVGLSGVLVGHIGKDCSEGADETI